MAYGLDALRQLVRTFHVSEWRGDSGFAARTLSAENVCRRLSTGKGCNVDNL